jgi:hypothetical protein
MGSIAQGWIPNIDPPVLSTREQVGKVGGLGVRENRVELLLHRDIHSAPDSCNHAVPGHVIPSGHPILPVRGVPPHANVSVSGEKEHMVGSSRIDKGTTEGLGELPSQGVPVTRDRTWLLRKFEEVVFDARIFSTAENVRFLVICPGDGYHGIDLAEVSLPERFPLVENLDRTVDDIGGNGILVVPFSYRDSDVLCAVKEPRIVGVWFVECSATKVRVRDERCCQVLSQRANGGRSYYDYHSNQ